MIWNILVFLGYSVLAVILIYLAMLAAMVAFNPIGMIIIGIIIVVTVFVGGSS